MKTPRWYQQEDAEEARRRRKTMIRYPPGLGKSETGTLAVWEPGVYDRTPCLIACPNHVVADWEDHLREEYPEARIAICAEQPPDVKRELLSGQFDFYVVNHLMLSLPKQQSNRNFYKMPKVKSFIIDESHQAGVGRKSRAFLGAKLVADKCELVLPMTGTPIRKSSDGLWPQLRLVDRTLTSYWKFVYEHCLVEETPWAVKIIGSKDSMQGELEKRSLYRTYQEVGLVLPDVVPYHHRVTLSDKTRTTYNTLKRDLRDEFNQPVFSAGAALSKLRVMTAHDENKLSKIKALVEDLDSFVVFCWYRETASLLAKELRATMISGEIGGQDRSRLAKASTRIVATAASLAASVDLSDHRDIVFYEEDYSPGIMENALARVARWRKHESDEPVRCRYIFASGTIDERVHNLTAGRDKDARQVYGERELVAQEING